MSRMLQALKNLSSESTPPPVAEESPAPEAALEAAPTPAAADPVLPPVDSARRMKDLLLKHLSGAVPTEIFRKPASAASASGTVPITSILRELRSAVESMPQGIAPSSSSAQELAADSGKISTAMAESVEMDAPPLCPESMSAGIVSIDTVGDLLATIEEEPESGEEVTLSFSVPACELNLSQAKPAESRPAEIQPAVSQRVELHPAESRPAPVSVPEVAVSAAPPQAAAQPAPQPAAQPAEPEADIEPPHVAASPLDHLADARPLVTYKPDEEEVPAPAAPPRPVRTICRIKTRLEQRVLDNLSHPSQALPYRELADRLQQDLRLLAGRCLLFTGIGPASHADDVLPHVASLLAEDDAEVLLVDANFTRAGMTVAFGALKETGLGELPQISSRSEQLVLPTLLPNVSVLPAGRKELPDTMGVIDQLAQLLARLEERYYLVLIDGGPHTGPLLPALARLCDATYFVVRLGATDARAATTALKTFRATGARVMGCVATIGTTAGLPASA